MDQEKFVSKYIEILNTTISEAIQKNIVAQAQKNVLETELNELLQQHEKLLSEKNNWITGQIFHVDGGMSTLKPL